VFLLMAGWKFTVKSGWIQGRAQNCLSSLLSSLIGTLLFAAFWQIDDMFFIGTQSFHQPKLARTYLLFRMEILFGACVIAALLYKTPCKT
jgi:hypothetical protein